MERTDTRFQYELELRRRGGEFLVRKKVDDAYLEPIADAALWAAQRQGTIGEDPSKARVEIAPIFLDPPGRPLDQVVVHVADGTSQGDFEYPLADFLLTPAREAASALVIEGRLKAGDDYEVSFFARPIQKEQPYSEVEAVVERAPLRLAEGQLSDWGERSELLNREAHCEEDMAVFVLGDAYKQIRHYCLSDGTRESGAMLVGRLFRQWEPTPDIFAVVEATFEAKHADQQTFSLKLSAESYTHFERQLEKRRKRLDHPEETLLGVAHNHPFLPAVGADSTPLCPGCSKRPTCQLHSAFYSAEDAQFHTSLFRKQLFAVGMVWGLSPREEDVLRVYGFRNGVLRERSLWLVD